MARLQSVWCPIHKEFHTFPMWDGIMSAADYYNSLTPEENHAKSVYIMSVPHNDNNIIKVLPHKQEQVTRRTKKEHWG